MKAKRIVAAIATALFCGIVFLGATRTFSADEGCLVKEVVKLLEAKVGEDAIKAFVSSKGIPVKISSDEIVALKKAEARSPWSSS